MVTGLANTGEDPAPSPQRAMLLHEMQTRGVANPNQVLANPANAMVLVRGFLPPGAQKGDHFDLEVQVPSRSGTTSLRGGLLMESRLTELAVLGDAIRDGHLLALGSGPILVDPAADAENDPDGADHRPRAGRRRRAFVRDRWGWYSIRIEKSIQLSAPRRRSHQSPLPQVRSRHQRGGRHPQDRRVRRCWTSIRATRTTSAATCGWCGPWQIRESSTEQFQRLQLLDRQLGDPLTAATAALRLEAIGKPAVPTLVKGIESNDPEVRCYAAEALAYLDDTRAAPVLAQAATDEPAFRAFALTALSAMDDGGAYDQLRALLGRAQRRNPLRGLPSPVGDELPRSAGPGRTAGRLQLSRPVNRRTTDDPRHPQLPPRDRDLRARTVAAHAAGDRGRATTS